MYLQGLARAHCRCSVECCDTENEHWDLVIAQVRTGSPHGSGPEDRSLELR